MVICRICQTDEKRDDVGTTAIYGWPWPETGVVADGPDAISDLALAMEATFTDASWSQYLPSWASLGPAQPSNPSVLVGRYRAQNKWCDLQIFLEAGGSTGGGIGPLYFSLPIQADISSVVQEQCLQAVTNTRLNDRFHGYAFIPPGSAHIIPYFPLRSGVSVTETWANSTDGGVGSGVPAVPGNWSVGNSNIWVGGRYKTI